MKYRYITLYIQREICRTLDLINIGRSCPGLEKDKHMEVLFKEDEVVQLLNDFQRFAKVRIAVFDHNFNELYSCPKDRSSFCRTIRENTDIDKACKYCDEQAFRQAKANQGTYIYKCHLGLYEAVTPIYNSKQILGYVMIGQILSDAPTDLQWKGLLAKYPKFRETLAGASEQYEALTTMSYDDIYSLVNIMQACATSIWLKSILDVYQLPLIEKVNNYLSKNYASPLDTTTICNDLQVSKSTLYNCLKSEFNMSLSQYLTHVRIHHAQALLENKNLSIADVAGQVGFEDYNYFTKKFKSVYGMTPSQYRKR